MPDEFDRYARRSSPTPAADPFSAYERQVPEQPEEEFNAGGAVLGGAALLGTALLARNPSMIGKALKGANAVRQQLMLSGLALPKSVLGNVGAGVADAVERRSISPLKELLFNKQTYRDIASSYKSGGSAGPTPGLTLPGPNPGKVMGAIDDASQKAFIRSGRSPVEAQEMVLQAPLTGKLGEVMEGPVAAHILPFRRTPFNSFIEGLKTVGPDYAHKGVTAGYAGAGAVHGSATADEKYPVTIPLATALAAKYGLPYALAAVAARKLAGGQGGGGILGSALPVSEYGVEQSLSDPFAPFVRPAAARFFE